MFRRHGRRFWIILALVALVFVFYFPSLIAYRYTADSQSGSFLTHPWRSWPFIYTAFTVPGDSTLKTSGAAFRKARTLFDGSSVSVTSVRLLFLSAGKPYPLDQQVDGETVSAHITPPYRFVWQVEGYLNDVTGRQRLIVMLFDYRTGRVLYNVLSELPRRRPSPPPTSEPLAAEPGVTDRRA